MKKFIFIILYSIVLLVVFYFIFTYNLKVTNIKSNGAEVENGLVEIEFLNIRNNYYFEK